MKRSAKIEENYLYFYLNDDPCSFLYYDLG